MAVQAGIFPYNSRLKGTKGPKSSVGGKASREKVKAITEQSAKQEVKRDNEFRVEYQALLAEGKATKRKRDGSYYRLG